MAFLDTSTPPPNFIGFFQSFIPKVNLSKFSDHPIWCAIPVGATLFRKQNPRIYKYKGIQAKIEYDRFGANFQTRFWPSALVGQKKSGTILKIFLWALLSPEYSQKFL